MEPEPFFELADRYGILVLAGGAAFAEDEVPVLSSGKIDSRYSALWKLKRSSLITATMRTLS